ncbi:hypothetical protein BJ742DRAFT_845903 [Cladochytrium replicatum]|nr:hypothetical protein BJ742DRAFT_845903 [Cladochytrium replicatum]
MTMLAFEPSPNPMAAPAAAFPSSTSSAFLPLTEYVFVGANRSVRAIRLSDGADLWEFKTPLTGSCSALPALLIEDGVLFVSGNRHVWALDPHKGQKLWCAKLPSGDSFHTLATMRSSQLCRPRRFDPSSSSPYDSEKSPSSGLLYAGLSSIDPIHGSTVYLHPPILQGTAVEANIIPLPSSSTAIMACGLNVYRVTLDGSSTIWANNLDGLGIGLATMLVGAGVSRTSTVPPPSYSSNPNKKAGGSADVVDSGKEMIDNSYADRVFVVSNGHLCAISVSEGAKLWEHGRSFNHHLSLRPPFVLPTEGRVYISKSNTVHCVDADSGVKLWESIMLESSFATLSTFPAGNGETNRSSVYLPVFARTMGLEQDMYYAQPPASAKRQTG